MPAAAVSLTATPAQIQQTLSLFLFGLAAGHAIYGPLADWLGRRIPLLAGLAIFCLGSALSASASTAGDLLTARLIQALGAAGGLVIPRAIITDLANGPNATRVFSLLLQITMIGPILGPILGSWLLRLFGWRSIFWALFLLGLCTLAWGLRSLPDTLPRKERINFHPRIVAQLYYRQISSQRFMIYALAGGVLFGAMTVYLNKAPFVLIQHFGVTPTLFSWIFAGNALGMVMASQIGTYAASKLGNIKAVIYAMLIQAIPPSALLLLLITVPVDRLTYLSLLSCSILTLGLPFGSIITVTMEVAGRHSGVASALMGLVHYTMGALIGMMATLLPTGLLDLPLSMSISAVVAALLCLMAAKMETAAQDQSEPTTHFKKD